eukprot:GHUV01047330.1.p1 GENE.GHUV01047330.1~~GHUV01047330.1.p1  ORF type:complete len:299 (+),score=57.66 GHUV01047330.1:884-1780(+)
MGSTGWGHDWLAAGCGDILKVWDPSNPKAEIKIYEGTNIHSVDFSHNNKVLAVASDKGQVVLYSSKIQESGNRNVSSLPNTPEPDIESFTCVRFAPDGSHLAAGANNGTVHVWNLRAGGVSLFQQIVVLTQLSVPEVAWLHHCEQASWGGRAYTFLQQAHVSSHMMPVSSGCICRLQVCTKYAPEYTAKACCNSALQNGPPRIRSGLSGVITSLAIDKSGSSLVATSSSGQVHIYDFHSGVKAATLQRGPGPAAGNACFSSLAPLLAVGHATGAVTLWDANSLERLTELSSHKVCAGC